MEAPIFIMQPFPITAFEEITAVAPTYVPTPILADGETTAVG